MCGTQQTYRQTNKFMLFATYKLSLNEFAVVVVVVVGFRIVMALEKFAGVSVSVPMSAAGFLLQIFVYYFSYDYKVFLRGC